MLWTDLIQKRASVNQEENRAAAALNVLKNLLKMEWKTRSFVGLFLLFLLCSCDSGTYFSEFKKLPESGWPQSNQPEFLVNIDDTSRVFDVQVMFRHAPQYPFQNLYLFMHTTFPSEKQITDTLTLFLFDAGGKPLGSCMGDLCDVEFKYRSRVKFPERGEYRFRLEHRMRTPDGILPLVMDAGLRLQNSVRNEK